MAVQRVFQTGWRVFSWRVSATTSSPNLRSFSSLRAWGQQFKPLLPEFCLEKQDGTVERIREEDLYRYSRHRWLFNETEELSRRYLKFNLEQLLKVAVDVCDGAQRCVKITKCSEGLHNKAFLLMMDNGTEVIAKLPNPNAGPARFTTASEVATREMLLNVFKIPVPRILAWSFDASLNPVEAEFIIEEKAPGIRLGSVWHQWPRRSKLQLITQVVDLENKLASITFDMHGCIYFKDDLRTLFGKTEDINIEGAVSGDVNLGNFAMGPLTSNELWNGTRKIMALDRGPWRTSHEYTHALGWNERSWMQSHAVPRMNYFRSMEEKELPGEGLALLAKYMEVASYLVPREGDNTAAGNVLWHLDLHLDNIFVDPETLQITQIVDWQSACVAPLFYQSTVPSMCKHNEPIQDGWTVPERPENYDELSEKEKKRVDDDLEGQILHKYYEAQVHRRAPQHGQVLRQEAISILRKPVSLATGVWMNHGLFHLREALMVLEQRWETIVSDVPCPITFSKEEIERHRHEEENIDGVANVLKLFRDERLIPPDGRVDPRDFEVACENNRKSKDMFVGFAQDNDERKLFEKLWPYQESEDSGPRS